MGFWKSKQKFRLKQGDNVPFFAVTFFGPPSFFIFALHFISRWISKASNIFPSPLPSHCVERTPVFHTVKKQQLSNAAELCNS
jgi:hypothetical protein